MAACIVSCGTYGQSREVLTKVKTSERFVVFVRSVQDLFKLKVTMN